MLKRRRVVDESDSEADEAAPDAAGAAGGGGAGALADCQLRCLRNPQNGADIHPHIIPGRGLLPCPLMFRADTTVFLNGDFAEVNPEAMAERVVEYLRDDKNAQAAFITMNIDTETETSRAVLKEFFQLAAVRVLVDDAVNGMDEDTLVQDVGVIDSYLDMMDRLQRPFATVAVADELQRNLYIDVYNNFMRLPELCRVRFQRVLATLQNILDHSNSISRFADDAMMRVSQKLVRIRNRAAIVMEARASLLNPNPAVFAREEEDHARHQAMRVVQTVLTAARAIIVNTSSDERVELALPILSDAGVPTYTYTGGMSIHNALQQLRADQVVGEMYVMHKRFINGVLATNNATSNIPYVPDEFVQAMRYIAWRNGVFCCRTLLFYYHRKCVPAELHNWRHFSEDLVKVNDGHIRALRYIDRDMDYYAVLVDLLRGVYNRNTSAPVREFYASMETEIIGIEHGGDTLHPEQAAAQDAFVRERIDNIDAWIHDGEFLKLLEPLDVRLRSVQKVMHDQRLPRDTYRTMLETFGRSLTGVIGPATRPISGSHRLIEAGAGRQIVDKLEYATVIEGTAGTGKSTLLSFIERYFSEDLIGHVSDNRRPIDPYSTLRGKALIIAADMQKEEQTPIGQGDLKKMISQEAMVNHRLHQNSVVTRFPAHIIFAMNEPLPFKDIKGDVSRRFVQIRHNVRISETMLGFGDNDMRNPEEVFEDEDLARFPLVAALAHKRRLLCVGNRSYYNTIRKDFPVPRYVLATQAEFNRMQNSFRAFMLGLELNGEVDFSLAYADHSVERERIQLDYKAYADQWKCPLKDDAFVDRYLVSTFALRITGVPLRVYGLRYKNLSVANAPADQAPADADDNPMDALNFN